MCELSLKHKYMRTIYQGLHFSGKHFPKGNWQKMEPKWRWPVMLIDHIQYQEHFQSHLLPAVVKGDGFLKGQLNYESSNAFKSILKTTLPKSSLPHTFLPQLFSFSFRQPWGFASVIFIRNKFYAIVLTIQVFFKSLWLLTLDPS